MCEGEDTPCHKTNLSYCIINNFFQGAIKMNEDNNAINEQLDSINSNLTKLEKHSLRIRDNVGLIWLTLVVYIVYVEFFK